MEENSLLYVTTLPGSHTLSGLIFANNHFREVKDGAFCKFLLLQLICFKIFHENLFSQMVNSEIFYQYLFSRTCFTEILK